MEQLHQSLSFLPAWAVGPLIALLIIVVGWFIAKIAAAVVAGVINKTGLGRKAKEGGNNVGKSLSSAVFWIVWLVFFLIGLGQFPLVANQLGFLNDMMAEIFSYLPKILAAVIVMGLGLVLANVIKNVIQSTLAVLKFDGLAARYGVGASDGVVVDGVAPISIASSIAKIVSTIVAILFAIAAIQILDIPGISQPIADMLDLVLAYIPRVIGAALILAIAVFIGRFVSNLAQSTLPALGLDSSLSAIEGLDGETTANFRPSKAVGMIAFIGIVLMGLTAAMTTLDIPALSAVFATLLALGGKIVLGFVIIGAGVFIANVVSKMIAPAVGANLSNIIRYIIIVLIAFMGLSEMNLGDGIVDSAFNWALGAAAVAGAIAFGLGGREWAKAKLHEVMPVKKATRAVPKK